MALQLGEEVVLRRSGVACAFHAGSHEDPSWSIDGSKLVTASPLRGSFLSPVWDFRP